MPNESAILRVDGNQRIAGLRSLEGSCSHMNGSAATAKRPSKCFLGCTGLRSQMQRGAQEWRLLD